MNSQRFVLYFCKTLSSLSVATDFILSRPVWRGCHSKPLEMGPLMEMLTRSLTTMAVPAAPGSWVPLQVPALCGRSGAPAGLFIWRESQSKLAPVAFLFLSLPLFFSFFLFTFLRTNRLINLLLYVRLGKY